MAQVLAAPVIHQEVELLAARYGHPLRRAFSLPADEMNRYYRFGAQSDRRAEVVFVIQNPDGAVWVHAKSHYPQHIYRLPSGGVQWGEMVEAALFREIDEETGLEVKIKAFLGLVEYHFTHEGQTAPFASYVFLAQSGGGIPIPHGDEAISEFRPVLPSQLIEIAADLRNIIGDRRGWGQWRALVHDLAYDALITLREHTDVKVMARDA